MVESAISCFLPPFPLLRSGKKEKEEKTLCPPREEGEEGAFFRHTQGKESNRLGKRKGKEEEEEEEDAVRWRETKLLDIFPFPSRVLEKKQEENLFLLLLRPF